MKISLVTPAGKKSRAGNRTTAVRWAKILRDLGHRVSIAEQDNGDDADMMVAVHAWRSHQSIKTFSDSHPDRPLVVLLAGTDIYAFQHSHPIDTLDSMERATALVCLHDLVHQAIPKRFGKKLNVIYQSAPPLTAPRQPSKRTFDVCVIGHLRDEKDSLRAAYAARLASPDSKLRVIHLGKAHNKEWARATAKEVKTNPRFLSLGEVPGWRVRRQFASSHAMVMSSGMEGGANVVSEAIVAGLPILASHIDGNVGLLGEDYEGYYPAQDTDALAALLHRAETDPKFLKRLNAQCRKKQALFIPGKETTAWKKLLAGIKP
ncbi:MAG: TIGR04348 family glycosyltransferase [Alphaproteobacteria bacterium]|nr:TIGR04348 family glycosyltransferase [Alphaproteobacteria bacterium]